MTGTANQPSIRTLFAEWQALTADYQRSDRLWVTGEISEAEFEDVVYPVLARRDAIEVKIFDAQSESLADFDIKLEIREYFEWLIPDYNAGLRKDFRRIAQMNSRNVRTPAKEAAA